MSTVYLALLRGINVGGGNLIKMADLKACFEAQGFTRVATYIQSGNVVFQSPASAAPALTHQLENALSTTFAPYQARVVVLTHAELAAIAQGAPAGFGSQPETHRYDVLYLKPPLTAAEAYPQVPTRAGVDDVAVGPGALYFSRLIAQASQSQLTRLVGLPIYQQMTIRNWNTTRKLLALMQAYPPA